MRSPSNAARPAVFFCSPAREKTATTPSARGFLLLIPINLHAPIHPSE